MDSSHSTDTPMIWSQLSHSLLKMMEESTIDDKQVKESCEAEVKQLNQLIKDIKKRIKEKDKKESELCIVDKAIAKANANIEKAEAKTAKVQEYIDKQMKKSEENKENAENVMNVWNIVGLRMEKKDNMYEIRLNKISVQEPNKWFCVKFTLEEDNKAKIVECEPKDSLDFQVIERDFAKSVEQKTVSQQKRADLRHLIALIRQNLKKRNN